MKRLLSVILALTLVIGMIPAVFASSENPIYSPSYVFKVSSLQDSNGTAPTEASSSNFGNYTVDGTTGVWNWAGSAETSVLNGHSFNLTSGETQFRVDEKPITSENAFVLTLEVDKSGTYTPKFTYSLGKIYGYVDVYLVHEDVLADKGWSLTASTIPLIKAATTEPDADVKLASSRNLNNEGSPATATYTENDLNLSAGKYYMFLSVSGASTHSDTYIRTYGSIRQLDLTCKGTVTANVGATALRVGGSTTISATVTDGTGAASEAAVTYTSSDDGILTVDDNGNISAVGEGTATITATANVGGVDVFDSVKITSTLVKGTITATADKTALKKGETAKITASAKDADGNDSDEVISFESSDDDVATVSADGTVTAVGEGTATITAKATIDGIAVTSNGVDVTVSVVWDPVYSFYNGAYTSSVASITQVTDSSMLNESVSTGKWQYLGGLTSDANGGMNIGSDAINNKGVMFYTGATTADGYWNALVLTATLENAGVYKPTINFWRENYGGKLNIYFVPKAYADGKNWFMGQVQGPMNAIDDSKLAGSPVAHIATIDVHTSAGTTTSFTSDNGFYLPAGEHYIVMSISQSDYENTVHDDKRQYGLIKDITLTRQASVETTASKTALAVGDTATLTSVVKDNRDNVTEDAVTYTSSNNNVAQVSGSIITAVGEGTATITATATVDGSTVTDTVEITVTKYEVAPKSLSLYVDEPENGVVSVTVDGKAADIVTSVAQGATVKVTANDTETHRFSHWLGTAGIASFDPEYTFNIYTNTALKAVYEEIPDEAQAVVSFYKPNRELFATKVVGKNTLFSAAKPATDDLSLVGYNTFLGWALGEDEDEQPIMVEDNYEITGDLGVVAVFEGKKAVTGMTIDNVAREGVVYGQAIELSSSGAANFRYWTRDDIVVSYNKEYVHYAWKDNAKIKAVVEYSEAAKPVAVLEKYGTTDSWMFEYEIPENCIRLEAGIIFGDSSDITIDSCYARAVSRRGAEDKHGQFTASSDYACAKGYIIFKDKDDKVCVVYSK